MTEFRAMQKIPRLSREIIVTEKLDGTNASVQIVHESALGPLDQTELRVAVVGEHWVFAGSRTRWITPDQDNHGFARWVYDYADELALLGPGHHFGEWWGGSIQRGYGLTEKRFSLFNVGRWADPKGAFVPCSAYPMIEETQWCPPCCHVVPILYRGPFDQVRIEYALWKLQADGSAAAPGFRDPEGIVVFHTASGHLFKKTIKGDEEGKHAEAHPPKPKAPRPPRDPSKGGRRIAQLPYAGADRRRAA